MKSYTQNCKKFKRHIYGEGYIRLLWLVFGIESIKNKSTFIFWYRKDGTWLPYSIIFYKKEKGGHGFERTVWTVTFSSKKYWPILQPIYEQKRKCREPKDTEPNVACITKPKEKLTQGCPLFLIDTHMKTAAKLSPPSPSPQQNFPKRPLEFF